LFYGVFVRFSTRGVQKHHKQLFGGSPCQKPFAKKVEVLFPVVFPLRFFYRVFFPVSLHEELKNTIKCVLKIRPKNIKKAQKKVGR
jgi:hypothetical protein